MILQKIKKSIEKIGIPCFLDYNDATSYCAVLIPETNGKESIKVDIQFIWEDGNPILLADKWIKSLRMNKELKAIVLGSGNNYAGFVLRVKVIDVSICSYIPTGNRYTITIENDPEKGTVSGAGKYLEGKTCTLTAYPNEQYYFVGWLTPDDDVVHDNPYSFTVDRDATYETYYLSKYHVEVVSAGNGTVSGSGYYEPTETCTITATPNTGYHFVNWTVNDLELTTDNPYSFIPTGDITITANFAINTYTISTSGTGGTITGSGTYNYGATCTLTATANTGYEFRRWMEYGETISTSNPYSFTVNSDRTITADFNQLSYTVSATSSGNGSVSGGGTYHYGDSITLTATPDPGYVFVDWTEGGSTLSSSNPYTFSCTGNQTIVGNFEEHRAPLIINTLGSGSSVYLANSNNQEYRWNLSEGENVYEGTEPGFALNEITGLRKGAAADYNIVSIDASGLTSWTDIIEFAFTGSYYLNTILLPDSIETIGRNAFEYCYYLASITLPASLTSIGEYAFDQDSNIMKLTLLSATPPTLGNYAFEGMYDFLVYVPAGTLSDYQNDPVWGGLTYPIWVEDIPEPSEDYLLAECRWGNTFMEFTNSNNQTYTWNLNVGKNYYTGTEPGFAINEITSISKDNNDLVSFDASKLTSWNTVEDYLFSDNQGLISIKLPDTLTTIGDSAFYYCSKLKSIELPSSLTRINVGAFQYCGITSITFPDSLTYLGDFAINGCSELRKLHIPANVSYIGSQLSLYSLIRITVDNNNQYYNDSLDYNCIIRTSDNVLILGCRNTYIPNTISGIGYGAFYGCGELTSISLPNSITFIESDAFYYCENLPSITLPISLTRIGDGVFSYCRGLTSINIPVLVNSIGNGIFINCDSLTTITVNSNNTTYNDGNGSNCIIETATNTLVAGCKNTVIPNTVEIIGSQAMMGLEVFYPEFGSSLTTIKYSAFSNTLVPTITLPSSISLIENGAFWESEPLYIEFEGTTPPTTVYDGITSNECPIYVPSSAVSDYQTAWPTYASRIMAKPEPTSSDYVYVLSRYESTLTFENSSSQTYTWNLSQGFNWYYGDEPGFALNEITNVYSEYATRFEDNWLYVELDLSKLTSWTTTYDYAFARSHMLRSVLLPNSLTTLGEKAFGYCENLAYINIPNSLTTIGNGAFAYTKLLTIELPASTTTIGDAAFNSCSGLTSITCLATTPPTLGVDVFTGDSGCPIYVPTASVSAYQSAWSQVSSRIQAIPSPTPSSITITTTGNAAVILTNSSNQTYTWSLTSGTNTYSGEEPGFALNEITGIKRQSTNKTNITSADISCLTSMTTLPTEAFDSCSNLTSVVLPDSITTFGDYAFFYCTSLPSITLPSSLTTIGQTAFARCTSLTSITLPNTITSMGQNVFGSCTNLTTANIPTSLTSIPRNMFSNCTSLDGITIHEGITSIGQSAFDTCEGLTSITFPTTLTSIDVDAFYGCIGLVSITCLATTPPTLLDTYIFDGDSGCPIYVPAASVSAYQSAWSDYASRIQAIPTP